MQSDDYNIYPDAPGGSSEEGGGGGGDPYAQIRQMFQSITGGKFTPTDADVSQWGTDIDANYASKIYSAIASWWQQQQNKPASAPTTTAAPVTAGTDGGNGGNGGNGGVDPYTGTVVDVIGRIPTEPNGTLSFYDAPDPFSYPDFAGHHENVGIPQLSPFDYPDFALPGGQEVLDEDPGYGVRRDQGLRGILYNKLSQGLGKSTGTMKALADYAGDVASQEYAAGVDRRFNTWNSNRGLAMDKWNSGERNKLTDYALRYGASNDDFSRAEDIYKTNLGKAATTKGFDLDIAAGKAGGRQGASSLAGNLALGAGNLSLGQSNSLFEHLISLYDLSTKGLPGAPAY